MAIDIGVDLAFVFFCSRKQSGGSSATPRRFGPWEAWPMNLSSDTQRVNTCRKHHISLSLSVSQSMFHSLNWAPKEVSWDL